LFNNRGAQVRRRALLPLAVKGMFAPLPVPERFANGFPYGLPIGPWQIRAEAQDTAAMVSVVAAMQCRYRELSMPVGSCPCLW
jgi:hypothetical protein